MMTAPLPSDLTQDIRNRINSVKGQLEGVSKMLEEGREPDQILNQMTAVQKGLDKAHYRLLDEVYRKALAIKIVEANDACPGDCGNEEKIQFLKEKFPNIELEELTDKLKEMNEITERLEQLKEHGSDA